MPIPSNLTNALEARRKSKVKNDKKILSIFEKYNYSTVLQLAERISKLTEEPNSLLSRRSFLIGSLKRLEDDGKIKSETELVHGKLIKKYIIKNSDKITIIIPNRPQLKYIQYEPHAYAIDADTIIVSTKNNKVLLMECKFNSKLKKLKQNQFELPNEFVNFYNLKLGSYRFEPKYDDDKIIIDVIRNVKSSKPNPKSKNSKNILVLEDCKIFAEKVIKRKLEDNGHKVTIAHTINEFKKVIKKKGKTFDIISLDNRVDNKNMAEDVSVDIRYYAPQAHIGLISGNFDWFEKNKFQDLAFEFVLKKKGIDWEEFFAWVSTV